MAFSQFSFTSLANSPLSDQVLLESIASAMSNGSPDTRTSNHRQHSPPTVNSPVEDGDSDQSLQSEDSPQVLRTDHISNGDIHSPSDEDDSVSQNGDDRPMPLHLLDKRRCSQSLTDAKEHAYARLMAELSNAQRELMLKDEECEKLSKLRGQMEHELDELTASLFEEANKMIQDAHHQRIAAENHLKRANNQIDILQGEVAALKHLVVTSTPSSPNRHLHPQISDNSSKKEKNSRPFWRRHQRSTSHHEFTKEEWARAEKSSAEANAIKEIDAVCFDEFQQWKLEPSLTDTQSPFLRRILTEDIQPCLNFHNKLLAERVLCCVQQNKLTMEPTSTSTTPRKCCLSNTLKLCNYRIMLEEGDKEWYCISQMCRNRIAAVCDFYTYIRYICQKLVKSSDRQMFQEVTKLRLQISMARLGC